MEYEDWDQKLRDDEKMVRIEDRSIVGKSGYRGIFGLSYCLKRRNINKELFDLKSWNLKYIQQPGYYYNTFYSGVNQVRWTVFVLLSLVELFHYILNSRSNLIQNSISMHISSGYYDHLLKVS